MVKFNFSFVLVVFLLTWMAACRHTTPLRANRPKGDSNRPWVAFPSDQVVPSETLVHNPLVYTILQRETSHNNPPLAFEGIAVKVPIDDESDQEDTCQEIKQPIKFKSCQFLTLNKEFPASRWPNVTFDSLVVFYDPEIYANITFYEHTFKDTMVFYINQGRLVENALEYDNGVKVPINKKITFDHCKFTKAAFFNDYLINGLGKKGDENISGSKFVNDLTFDNCELGEKLDFSWCTLDSTARITIRDSYLPDTLDLSHCDIANYIDLLNAFPNRDDSKKCEINLLKTDASKIHMQYQPFHLYIPDSVKEDVEMRDDISSKYERLLSNFKTSGFESSYEQLDIEYKNWQAGHQKILYIPMVWWNFGYAKHWILYYSLGFWLIFSIFNYRKYRMLQLVFPIEKLAVASTSEGYNFMGFRTKKYIKVLLYTGLIFFKLNIDFKNINFRFLQYAVFVLVQYSIGLVCTGFLVNWILKS
ncbi:MAG TPA: hypothetical protein VNS58_09135 [Puia sp.]|nr:hypothetical protein [Puia sp.]